MKSSNDEGCVVRTLQDLLEWSSFMFKVLITDKLAKEGIDLINATEGAEAVVKVGINEDELATIIRDYDGLIVRSDTKVTAKVLANPGRLKGVARAGVGVDNIDVPAATRKGILVMNTPAAIRSVRPSTPWP